MLQEQLIRLRDEYFENVATTLEEATAIAKFVEYVNNDFQETADILGEFIGIKP